MGHEAYRIDQLDIGTKLQVFLVVGIGDIELAHMLRVLDDPRLGSVHKTSKSASVSASESFCVSDAHFMQLKKVVL